MSDSDQFAENGVFEFQFDAINDRFEHDLQGVETDILDGHDRDIEDENNDVDDEQLMQNAMWATLRS